jgi:hypothetical protein
MARGIPFAQMTTAQKVRWICKLSITILTFGFIFPNVMGE